MFALMKNGKPVRKFETSQALVAWAREQKLVDANSRGWQGLLKFSPGYSMKFIGKQRG